MAEREKFDAEAEERRWWDEWFKADYSWEGLGKRDAEGQPEKSWHGWVVADSQTGPFCLPRSSLPAKGRVLRSASLQDYWRADPTRNWRIRSNDELVETGELSADFEPSEQWHIAHVPPRPLDGAEFGWKADPINDRWHHLRNVIKIRMKAAENTELTEFGIIAHTDFRAQMDGVVSKGSFFSDRSNDKPISLTAQRSYNFDDLDYLFLTFCNGLDFSHSYFASGGFFSYAKFLGPCRFNSAIFVQSLGVIRASFFGAVYMNNMKIGGITSISNSKFEQLANFNKSKFTHGAYFDKINALDKFDLSEVYIGNKLTLEGSHFKGAVDLKSIVVVGPESCWRSAFDSARFEDFLDFRKSPYRLIAMFDGARLEGGVAYPKQGETSALQIFDQDVVAAINALHDRNERDEALKAVEHGAQVLKHQMRLQADSLREQRFYRFELIARRLQSTTHWSERWSSRAFAFLGDYGLSVARPLAALACVALIFGLAYFLAAASITHMSLDSMTVQWGAPIHPAIAHPLELALTNMLGPLRYWGSGFQPYGGEGDAGFRLVIGGLGLLQQLLSLILIFLTALALRRRFQIA